MVLAVPAEKEAEVDAMWKQHETFMRETHCLGKTDGNDRDDGMKVRLLNFHIAKGPEKVRMG